MIDALLREAIAYLRSGGDRLPLHIAAELLARGYDVTALEAKYAA